MVELNELFEQLAQKFNEREKMIESQILAINGLKTELKDANKKVASLQGEVFEKQARLQKVNELLKGVKME